MLSAFGILSVVGFATAVSAATHDIKVGNLKTGIAGLTFTPNITTAAVGDSLVFHFYPGNHNVVQGTFSKPCQALSDGFYSGFISPVSGEASEVFTVIVNDTNPIWIYCSEIQHCQLGMAGVINPPDTLEAYIVAAANTSNSTTPPTVAGGVFSSNTASSPSSPPLSSSSIQTATAVSSSTASAKPTSQTTSGTSGAASLIDRSSVVWIAMAAILGMGAGLTGVI